MSAEIINVLDALCEKLGIAVDWSQQNILPYLQELMGKYIQCEIWTSIAWIAIWAVLTLAFALCTKKAYIKHYKSNLNEEEKEMWFWFFVTFLTCALISAGIGIIVTGCQIFDIVTCLTFPEKLILEYVKTLV